MDAGNTLKDLGLDEKEAKVYLALLELGEASVLAISKKAEVKRPTAYLVLRSLEEQGYVSRVLKGKKTIFSAAHPRKLVTEAELRLRELQEAVPQLELLLHREAGRPRVLIYEGRDELDRAYDESFVVKEMIYMGTLKLSLEALPRTYRKLEYVAHDSAFRIRELIDESEESHKYAERVEGPYREVRFMNKDMLPFEADIGIFGHRTLITSVRGEYFTVVVESEEISQAFRKIFEVMWNVTSSS